MYTSGKDDDRDCNYRRQLHLVANVVNLVSHKIVTEQNSNWAYIAIL